ncbi:hypothetical protein [Kiloniella laminariae]|uniref:hypothetical protein n=1 Tax=Kiloniella laminariae TaxID=454162 RepID=UPI0003A06C66|nr:hypothetical protein [Kiloniella laminariae]
MAYREYLAQDDFSNGSDVRDAFVINPQTGQFSWYQASGGRDPKGTAVQKAMNNCGEGCYLFDLDKKIVWQGYEDKDKLQETAAELSKAKMSYYNPDAFEINPYQLRMFQTEYIPDVIDDPKGDWAFAISDNGQYAYLRSTGRSSYYDVREYAFRSCLARAPKSKCVVYAVNQELLTEK